MSTVSKDKRTKEQLLQILSNALTQEEQLGEKIKMLENELAVCQKQNEDSRAEINQFGLSASKESFRIDYYKTIENGRLKGIIEHLPTRQKKSFKGLGIKLIAVFMERFLPENNQMEKPANVQSKDLSPAKEQPGNAIDFLGNTVQLVNHGSPENPAGAAVATIPEPEVGQQEPALIPGGGSRLLEKLRAEFQPATGVN